jgi:hypothetical protein
VVEASSGGDAGREKQEQLAVWRRVAAEGGVKPKAMPQKVGTDGL